MRFEDLNDFNEAIFANDIDGHVALSYVHKIWKNLSIELEKNVNDLDLNYMHELDALNKAAALLVYIGNLPKVIAMLSSDYADSDKREIWDLILKDVTWIK